MATEAQWRSLQKARTKRAAILAKARADGTRKAKKYYPPKLRLLMRSELDGRTAAAKVFDTLVTELETDLAPSREQLSAIERALVEAFAGSYVMLSHLNGKLIQGHEVDAGQHAVCVGAMAKVARMLGLERRQRDVSEVPSVEEYFRYKAQQKVAADT
jgi:hypothetical protein